MTTTACTAAALLGAAACGGESPEDVAVAYLDAVEEGDNEATCELVTAEARAALQGRMDCAPRVPIIEFPEASDSTVEGDTAEVEVTGSGDETAVVDLVDEDGEWRVEGVSEP